MRFWKPTEDQIKKVNEEVGLMTQEELERKLMESLNRASNYSQKKRQEGQVSNPNVVEIE